MVVQFLLIVIVFGLSVSLFVCIIIYVVIAVIQYSVQEFDRCLV